MKSNVNNYLISISDIYIANLEDVIVFKSSLREINYLTT